MSLTPEEVEAAWRAKLEPKRVELFTPIVVALMLDPLLLGILFGQITTWYRKSYTKERWPIKVLAGYISLIATTYTVLLFVRALNLFAIRYGQYAGFGFDPLARTMLGMTFMTLTAVEVFFAHRAWILSNHSKIIAFILALGILAVLGTAAAALAVFPSDPKKGKWVKLNLSLFIASSSLVAIVDALITGIILIQLWKRRMGTDLNKTLINRLMILSVESQLPLTILAVIICIMDATNHVAWSFPVVAVIGKCSSITLFAVLNARRTLRAKISPEPTSQMESVPPRDRDFDSSYGDKSYSLQTPSLNGLNVINFTAPKVKRTPSDESDNQQYSFDEIISKGERSDASYPPPTPYLPNITERGERGERIGEGEEVVPYQVGRYYSSG